MDESPASPCIRNCCLDQNDICLGCFRSVDEICAWSTCDAAGKHRILDSAANRKQQRNKT